MIQYHSVTKVFGSGSDAVTAVDDVSLDIEAGQLVVFLGPSGCGKTTLLRLTNRMLPVTRGKITVEGDDIMSRNPVRLRQSMGYAIQQVGLFPNKTIYGNIATVPRLLKWSEDRIHERARELMQMLQLDADRFLDRYPAELSGGQQQRIGVARCLAADPEILLMDEPFGAIDPINRVEIQNQFLQIQKDLQKTILFVTHDIQEAIKMGDRIAIFQEGRLVQCDTPENLLTRPRNEYIADFLGTDRALKVMGLKGVGEAMSSNRPNSIPAGSTAAEVRQWFSENDFDHAVVVEDDRPVGYLRPDAAEGDGNSAKELARPYPGMVRQNENLKDALSALLMHELRTMCVVDEAGKWIGTLSLQAIQRMLREIYKSEEKE